MKRILLSLALSLCVSAAAPAAPPVSLTLHPAKIPSPALKYPLLPDQRRLTNDDAAPLYRKAIETAQRSQVLQPTELYKQWLKMPLSELPRDQVAEQLRPAKEVFDLLDKAACCERCDWGILEAIRTEGFFPHYQEIDPLERLGLLLAVRVRLHLAEGRFDEAITGLQTVLAMAKHVGEGHSTSHLTTGYLIADVLKQLDTYVEQPGAPNLYWSLAALPRPLIDLRNAMHGQRLMAFNVVPGLATVLNDPQAGTMTPEQLQKCGRLLEGVRLEPNRTFLDRMHFVEELKSKHEIAKTALIAAGRPRDKVEAMPHVQVALLHSFLEYDQRQDDILKWQNAPYWEVVAFTKETARHDKQRAAEAPVVAMADLFFASPERTLLRPARIERHLALWRTIEALRHYAATHDGQLPASLDAVKDLPIPVDPMTGKSFAYERTGDTATLRAVPPQLHPREGAIYELKMKP